ncbi:MAG: dUTP diphosphatase [Clostridia bacterium]|nr:dUTP diphosphatase [Clostridia bacterium]
MKIDVVLDAGAIMPTRAHKADAGLDLYTPKDFCINGGDSIAVDTGVHIAIPYGWVGFVKSKSGLMFNKNILAGEGTVDSEYTGSVCIKLYNFGTEPVEFKKGDKIAQLVIVPCALGNPIQVEELPKTDRGNGGFGSTGK